MNHPPYWNPQEDDDRQSEAEGRPTIHPSEATDPSQLTPGQRAARAAIPGLAAIQDRGLCILCRLPQPDQSSWSDLGRQEWKISGMCEPCFDRLFADE